MSKLIEGLERIEAWLKINMPDKALELRPGLRHCKINKKVKDLPFHLPQEVYDLYEWRNGDVYKFAFQNYDLLSIDAAITAYYEWLGEIHYSQREEAYYFEKSFPIFQLWCDHSVHLCVVCDNLNDNPVQMLDLECRNYSLRYRNLTDMILHIADSYELAQYYKEDNVWELDVYTSNLLDSKYLIQ